MKFIAAVVLAVLMCIPAQAELGSLISFTIVQTFEGKEYSTVVTRPEIDVTPSWDPEKEDAPFSPHQAVLLAKTWLSEHFPNRENWAPLQIELRSIQNSDKWYYVVACNLYDENTLQVLDDRLIISVLMTGTIPQITVTANK